MMVAVERTKTAAQSAHMNRERVLRIAWTSVLKLRPKEQLRNPMMFTIYIAAILASILLFIKLWKPEILTTSEPLWFIGHLTFWLWITVLSANIAESVAEGKGKAQAESLRKLKREIKAKRIRHVEKRDDVEMVSASALREGDLVVVQAGDFIPSDGQVLDGIASVDESAITGESAPVIRESGGDSDGVTGGTRVLSDWLVIRITANPGETFIDKMVSLVEGAKRQKTPNEIALNILLISMTALFLLAVACLLPFSIYSAAHHENSSPVSLIVLIALFVCLAPTTIGGLLSAIGIAGMNRLLKANVIAMSGRAVEAAGDVHVLLLDKTGTITHGNRQAEAFYPAAGISPEKLAKAAFLASSADSTPEGKSIVALAKKLFGIQENTLSANAELIPFSAETRISGVRDGAIEILKGAEDSIANFLKTKNVNIPQAVSQQVEQVARLGGTPLVVIENTTVLGVIYLKDIVKHGIKERLADLRKMGITSVMITGDNPITAAAIAAEAGVDDYLAQATPERKLKLIREKQAGGQMVAMVGDGTNDAPALAQSDVAVVMNSGTQAAKDAGNMVDLDSDPTKLIEIVQIGKQLLMTRGALTTLSFSNDIAKYFAIVPAAFVSTFPVIEKLDVMQLASPLSAILSAIIFNALMIVILIPQALKGVAYRPMSSQQLLRRNLLIYGVAGLILPFIGIKLVNLALVFVGLV
jgi:K+-transporting ATPase ATPase B chain